MGGTTVGPWVGVLGALGALVVLVALLARYRALERRGTPLPPGAGGARLVGLRATVVRAHVPGRSRGVVVLLGDRWDVAERVAVPLAEGSEVVVQGVTGTRLVVGPADGTEP